MLEDDNPTGHNRVRGGHVGRFLLVLVLAPGLCASIATADVGQPDGYRMELYDDTVPTALDGAGTITAVELKALRDSDDAVVIDVIPQHRRPRVLPENQIWYPVEHEGVAGAIWLPDTGYGVLSDITEHYFKHNMSVATGGDKGRHVVFYCRTDCWMSWNAAKRALSYGYTKVHWFRNGIDEWFFEGYDVEVLTPAEGQRQAQTLED